MKDFYKFLLSDITSQFGAGLVIAATMWSGIDLYHTNKAVSLINMANLLAGIGITVLLIPVIDSINSKKLFYIHI